MANNAHLSRHAFLVKAVQIAAAAIAALCLVPGHVMGKGYTVFPRDMATVGFVGAGDYAVTVDLANFLGIAALNGCIILAAKA